MARLLFIEDSFDNDMLAFLKFESKIIASFKDKFIIRTYSPITTIGGGEILDVNISGKWHQIKNYIVKFENKSSDLDFIKEIIQADPLKVYTKNDLSKHLGISSDKLITIINKSDKILFIDDTHHWILTYDQKNNIQEIILDIIKIYHKTNSFKKGMLLEQINESLYLHEKLLKIFLLNLINEKIIKFENDYYSIFSFAIKLSKDDIRIKNELLNILDTENYETSGLSELSNHLNVKEDKIKKILKILDDDLVVINGNIFFTKTNYY